LFSGGESGGSESAGKGKGLGRFVRGRRVYSRVYISTYFVEKKGGNRWLLPDSKKISVKIKESQEERRLRSHHSRRKY